MNEVRLQALAGLSSPYRPRERGDVSGTFEFLADLISSDGWMIGEECIECRCRYLVNLVGRQPVVQSTMTDPPEQDSVKEIGEFEMKVRKKNPEFLKSGAPRYLTAWKPVPADLLVYVQRWIDTGAADERIIEEARESASV